MEPLRRTIGDPVKQKGKLAIETKKYDVEMTMKSLLG